LQIDKKGAMKALHYRKSIVSDINDMAKIRAAEWGTEEHWQQRITGYLNSQLHPHHALTARVCYVALKDATLIGFIAGHLSTRFNCDGELQWINVVKEQRGSGVALELLHLLAKWFAENEAQKICVDPGNEVARKFYLKHGTEALNNHWLFWRDINVLVKKNC
jgi:RimJ/RimL family protein N-acetyltransferase